MPAPLNDSPHHCCKYCGDWHLNGMTMLCERCCAGVSFIRNNRKLAVTVLEDCDPRPDMFVGALDCKEPPYHEPDGTLIDDAVQRYWITQSQFEYNTVRQLPHRRDTMPNSIALWDSERSAQSIVDAWENKSGGPEILSGSVLRVRPRYRVSGYSVR